MREQILHRLGSVQHALVTRRQLLTAGMTRGQVDHLVRIDRLVAMHEGIYRLAGAPITWDQRLLAGCLAARGSSSHRACAAVWGVELGPVPPVEVAVARAHGPRPRGVIVHRSMDLTPHQIVRRRGIPVTNPLRMLVDLGAVAGHEQVEHALDTLTSKRIITIAGVRAYRDRYAGKGRRGVGVLGEVLDNRALGDERADGLLEPVMARLCKARGLPQPAFQTWVWVAEGWRRMDFAYMAEMINIEVDGYENHGGKFENWADDAERDNELTAVGWLVIRFTWNDVRRRPGYVARIVGKILTDRRRQLGAA